MITTKEMIEWVNSIDTQSVHMTKAITDFITAHSWQDISTAPRDGARILLYSSDDGICTGVWCGTYKEWELEPDGGTEFSYDFIKQPTHWMPLPAAPQPPEDQI